MLYPSVSLQSDRTGFGVRGAYATRDVRDQTHAWMRYRSKIMFTYLKFALDDASAASRSRIISLYAFLLAVNCLASTWAIVALSDRPTLLATALLAYLLGLRHAVDADHIATIDNVVRKLMQDGRHPLAIGLFFAFGHSLSVAVAVAAIAAAALALQSGFQEFRAVGSIIGTGASAFFLLTIAAINFVILRDVWRSFQRARRGERIGEHEFDLLLSGRGLLPRLLRPLFRMVTASWQMFAIGLLFGLGFDTATEISLFTVAAGQASGGLDFSTVMIFPALFAAGMMLVDTTDSVLMVGAYGWAFLNPIRKIWYNLTITAISVVVALLIGGIEALGLLANKFALEGTFWSAVDDLNSSLANFGYLVVGIFLVSWALSFAIYRWQGLEKPLKPG
ncbi:HoxN/HupN/NixA family nickel/cobalt transporter [Bradyrhizobium brasilense]|uniref:HoxN/HupN/NixA family nickel/cobalt transporter n=1 Tax=Bradyrhizobium brasilense TaxID=1419277 RepID=UPI0035316857